MSFTPLSVQFTFTSTRLLPLPLTLTIHGRTSDGSRPVYLELDAREARDLYQALQDFMLRVRFDG